MYTQTRMNEVCSEILPQNEHSSSSENCNSVADNVTPPPSSSPQQAFQLNEKCEAKVNKNFQEHKQVNQKEQRSKHARSNSVNTPSDSPEEEDDDLRSLGASSKDSGCGKSYVEVNTPKRNKSGDSTLSGKSQLSSETDLEASSTLFWGASLLYYTGLPSPRVKEHHFASSLSLSPSPASPKKYSLIGRKLRSTLSLGSDDNMERRRPRSPFKKFYTIPRKSPSNDSGNDSSAITDASIASSKRRDVPEEKAVSSGSISPLRKRHLRCVSPAEKESVIDNLKEKITGNASSLRLLKVSRPGLPSFLERTQSLPRSSNKISEEEDPVAASCSTAIVKNEIAEMNSRDFTVAPEKLSTSTTSSTTSGFKSAKKAIRNSFKAARNLLPSSKINLAEKTNQNDKKNCSKKDAHETGNDLNEPPMANCSVPNTPVVIKKSRIERAKKKFASTLSLHTGSSSCGGGGARSKSASTLVISDSELNPNLYHKCSDHYYCGARGSSKSADNLYEERAVDVLTVIEHPSASPADNVTAVVMGKSRKEGNLKSPFRFIVRSKTKIDSKSETSPEKEEFQRVKEINDESAEGKKNTKEAIQPVDAKHDSVVADGSKEKPNKKRTSIMKTIGKAIARTGKGNKETNKAQTVSDSKFRASEREDPAVERKSGREAQEIVTFENEPKVRTPKVPRRQRLISGSGGSASTTSSSVGYTPPHESFNINTSSGSSTQVEDKDREIHELEVSETSIDISPERVFHPSRSSLVGSSFLFGRKSHQNDSNDNACHMRNVGHKDYDQSNKVIPGIGTVHVEESNKAPSFGSPINSKSNKSELKTEEKKKKTKSHSLITSLVTSSSGKKSSENSIMDDGKKKKKSGKKAPRKKLIAAVSTLETRENLENDGGSFEKVSPTTNDAPSNKNGSNSPENEDTRTDPRAEVDSQKVENRNDNQVESTLSSSSSKINARTVSQKNGDVSKDDDAIGSDTPSFVDSVEKAYAGAETGEKNILETKLDLNEDQVSSTTATSIEGNCSGDYGFRRSSNQSKGIILNGIANTARDQNANCSYNSHNKIDTAVDYVAQPERDNNVEEDECNEAMVADETDDPETACSESFRMLKPFNYDLEPVKQGKKERLYKVLVVGELGTGKTSIIKRYVHQFFSQHYRATIGVDFALKVLRWDPDTVVRLQLWDIAGQERFGSMTRVYYKEAVGAFVVFDVTRSATLEAVPKWKADLDNKVVLPDGRPIPTVLLANKGDQPKEGIAANREKMNEFCQQQGFSAWFETSAKDNVNIDESANFLVSKILEMDKWSQEPLAPDPDKLDLTANGKHKGSSASNCAC